jgi:membrane associated rhomboid family serine protease
VKAAIPPATVRVRDWNARQTFPVTKAFMLANLIVFVYLVARDANAVSGSGVTQGTFDLGLARAFIADGQWYRLVTSGFIHFGLIHLAFNGLALWNVGQMLESAVGSAKFALLYIASLLAGSAGVLLLETQRRVAGGASGAVFGLFGATVVVLKRQGINPFQTSIGTVLIINLVLTFTISGISIGGHLGGLVGGALCGLVLGGGRYRQPPSWVQWAVPVGVALASVVIAVVVSG